MKKAKKFDIDSITPEHAISALKTLVHEDAGIARRVQDIIEQLIKTIDPESVADELYSDLECIDVEDLWSRSGSTRDGYVEPCEMAVEMVEEIVEKFDEKLKECQSLSMHSEAALFCMGILKGLYLFDKESGSEFRNWADDVAGEIFSGVLSNFSKSCQNKNLLRDVEKFVEENCPEWHFEPA